MSFHGVRTANAPNRRCSLNDDLECWLSPLPNLSGGGTWYDVSGRDRGGVLTDGPTWVSGPMGYAVEFDGTNDHVLIPDFSYGPYFSLSFWFRCSDLAGSGFQYMFSHGQGGVQNSVNIYHAEAGHADYPVLRTFLRDTDDADWGGELDISVDYNDDTWHLYTLTVGSGGSIVYIDGQQKNDHSLTGGDAFNPTTGIYLGGREDLAVDRFFPGRMTDLRITNRTLTPGEVFQLDQDSLTGYRKTLNRVSRVVGKAAVGAFGGTNQIIGGGMIGV